MKRFAQKAILLLTLASGAVLADVSDSSGQGFTSVNTQTIDGDASRVWQAATDEIGKWWHPDHTLSGDASRLTIEASPQGCFCERLGEDAGIVHLTVTAAAPPRLLRLTGGLGPLGVLGVQGNMTWEFEHKDGSTVVRFTYAVGGYLKDGLDAYAEPVDAVIAEALQRLKSYVETGSPAS